MSVLAMTEARQGMILLDFLADVHADHVRLGFSSANCDACWLPAPEPAPVTDTAWWRDAIANCLRPMVVGGVPIDPHESGPGQEAQGLPAVQRADALAGGSSAGDPAGSGRAIAQATPGRTHHMRPTGLSGDSDPADRECVSGPLQAESPLYHIRGRCVAHGNHGELDAARLCVEPEQGAPSGDDGQGRRTYPPDRLDSPSGAGRVVTPRASATSSRQAAASVVSPAQ